MKLLELQEKYKQYLLILSNKSEHLINGDEKEAIINGNKTFITLPSGSVINKAFIVEIKLNIEQTKNFVNKNKNLFDEPKQLAEYL